jgi:tetratricopeptide (TPR) repeat protein/DNA-binding winged helix-turn-helix (wHTH) protein
MKELSKHIYRFDGVELDPSQSCLSRSGQELPLRQKSLGALLYLIEQRHRLVTKEELIARVWDGMAVTDDALVQLIREIRQSLGDDSRQPRFIKTVPRAGYRFIAPVEEIYVELPRTVGSVDIERHVSVEVEYEEEVTGENVSSTQEMPRWNIISRLRASPLTRVSLLIAAVVLLVTGGLVVHRFSRRSSSLAEVTLPAFPGKRSIAVMYFDNQSGDQDLEWLREGLADMVITGLSRSKNLNVLSRQQLYVLVQQSGYRPAEAIRLEEAIGLGQKSHAEVIALGSFARLGTKLRIEVNLHNADSGQSIASEGIVADTPESILTQVDLLSVKLARHLGASSASQQSGKLDDVMTSNLEAYRFYSLAVEKAQGLHNADAILLLEKAVALDPEFAMAHARIGYAHAVTGNDAEAAKRHLEKAFTLSTRLTEKDRLYIRAWYAIANLDYATAIGSFREIIAVYPMETEAYARLSMLLLGEDRLDEALAAALQGLAVDAESKDLINQTSGLYSTLGRHDEAIAMIQRYIALAPNEPNAYDSLGLFYQWAGRYQQALEAYQHALALKPNFEVALIHLGNVHFQQGRYREAIEIFNRYIAIGPSDNERGRGYSSLSAVYLKRGELDQSKQAAKKALTYVPGGLWQLARVMLAQGNTRLAEEFMREYNASSQGVERGRRPPRRVVLYLQGLVELKNGRAAEAVAAFTEALQHRPVAWEMDAFEDCLANAYLELGRWDEAIAEYQRILRLNPNYPLAEFHLAQVYEKKGRTDLARASYERFLQIWKDADREAPELKLARSKVI